MIITEWKKEMLPGRILWSVRQIYNEELKRVEEEIVLEEAKHPVKKRR